MQLLSATRGMVKMRLALCILVAVFTASSLFAEEPEIREYSEYSATILRVIDGDTLEVRVAIWPGLEGEFAVRVRGIDAPELQRPECIEEQEWGQDAQVQAKRLYDTGSTVRIENVVLGSFAGRVIADVSRWRSDRWLSFADEMIERKMAVPWNPGDEEVSWCALAVQGFRE